MSALLLAGCIGGIPSPFRPSPGPQKTPQPQDLAEAFNIVCRNYRVGPEDVLRVVYQPEYTIPTGTFKLDNMDRIMVKFLVDPSLNEDVVIRPDGMITVQGIGDVQAAGLTPEQLARKIERKFVEANILQPQTKHDLSGQKLVTVHVTKFFQKLEKLATSLSNIAGGQQNTVVVKPDGTVDLPLLEQRIMASGSTVREIEKTVNDLYQKYVLKHANVSISLVEAKSRKFYVFGEVGAPGAYSITQPITVMQAIAMAGGHNRDTADITSVILISKNVHGKPIGRRIDVKRTLDTGDMGPSILVKPYDVIYVPKTYVRDVRLFIEYYVNAIEDFIAFGKLLATL